MSLITFEPLQLPTTEDIVYVKKAIKVANINIKQFIAIVLPVILLQLNTVVILDLLTEFLEEYYVKNEEEFIETSITLIDYEDICQLMIDNLLVKEISINSIKELKE